MPHHPSEEETTSHITDKVMADSKDAATSDHPMHDENKGPYSARDSENAGILKAGNKGPVIPEGDLPEAKGKDEIEAETKKLNS